MKLFRNLEGFLAAQGTPFDMYDIFSKNFWPASEIQLRFHKSRLNRQGRSESSREKIAEGAIPSEKTPIGRMIYGFLKHSSAR